MTGHINYGGRVTDDWDRTCLLCILKRYYSDEFFSNKYKFDQKGNYQFPPGDKPNLE